jgi:hypothetical protein
MKLFKAIAFIKLLFCFVGFLFVLVLCAFTVFIDFLLFLFIILPGRIFFHKTSDNFYQLTFIFIVFVRRLILETEKIYSSVLKLFFRKKRWQPQTP